MRIHLSKSFWFSLIVSLFCLGVFTPKISFAESESPVSGSQKSLMPINVQLNWNHQYQFAGFYAAIMQGYYQDLGLEVTAHSWKPGINIVDEVLSGRADFGVGYSSLVVDYIKGAPIKLVMASFQYSPMVLLSHFPLEDLSQLSGKKVQHYGNLQILGLLNKASTLVAKPIISLPSSGDLNDFISHKVDFYAAYSTNEPYRLKEQGIPFYEFDPKEFGIQSLADLVFTSDKNAEFNADVVQKFKQATQQGWAYALAHPVEVVDYIMQHYPVVKTRDAMLYEAKNIGRYVKTGNTPIGSIEPAKILATAAEAKDIGLITLDQLSLLDTSKMVFNQSNYLFTDKEKAYLKSHPVIKLASDNDWEPFEFVNDKGEYQGITADYFRLFEKKLGVKFEFNKDLSWSHVVDQAVKGELPIYSCAVATPERKKYMNFTAPYLSFPMVIVGRTGDAYVEDYNQLNGRVVAVVKGYWSQEYLEKQFPNIKVLLVNNVKQGLDAVVNGKAYAYSGNLGVVNYNIQHYGLAGLQVIGQAAERFELAIGVHKSEPILFDILQKALANVSQDERQAIFNKWFQLEVVQRLDTRQIKEITLIVLVVVLAMLFWVLFYRYQKNRSQDYINTIHELTYASLIDIKGYRIVWSSQSYQRLTGYSAEELAKMNYFDMASREVPKEIIQGIAKQVLSGNSWTGEMQGCTKDGRSYWVELTLTPRKSLFGKIKQVWATRVDISDKKRIEQISILDDLTGLYNRRYFNQKIQEEINRAKRDHKSIAVAMLDIDFFKHINDSYGHQRGDEVLIEISDVLKGAFGRAQDFVFRMGGEEFFVISSFRNEIEFEAYLQQLKQQIWALKIQNLGSDGDYLTISIGGAFYVEEQIPDADQLYHIVDACLYDAKEQGRNRVIMAKQES